MLEPWHSILACPLDHTPLRPTPEGGLTCPTCGFAPPPVHCAGRTVPDFRAQDTPRTVTQTFRLPVQPLDRAQVAREHFRAPAQGFPHYSRREVRRRFGTKLDKGMQFYCQHVRHARGPDAPVLDLGCGSGGNRRYLETLGFRRVLPVDWGAAGADLLVDAHALPFADGAFALVLSTAVFEHLYNPFVAMAEVARVLEPGGWFVGSASFWEGWHGSSYFHLTPDGWAALFGHAGLELVDLWAGWGVLPALFSHVLTPERLRAAGYLMQWAVEGVYRLALGRAGVRRLHLRASGSYQVSARKP